MKRVEVGNSKWKSRVIIFGVLCTLWVTGFATSAPPAPTRIVQLPQPGPNKLVLIVQALPPVGSVLPVWVVVTNLMPKWIKLEVQQIRARRIDGATVGVLSPDQAKEAAGGADKLTDKLSKVYLEYGDEQQKEPTLAQTVAGGCIYLPFAVAPNLGLAGLLACPIAIVGGISIAVGRSVKAAAGAANSKLQLDDIALSGDRDLHPGDKTQGYIFLSVGDYATIEVPVTNLMTGGLETIVQTWDSTAQLATEVPASVVS